MRGEALRDGWLLEDAQLGGGVLDLGDAHLLRAELLLAAVEQPDGGRAVVQVREAVECLWQRRLVGAAKGAGREGLRERTGEPCGRW